MRQDTLILLIGVGLFAAVNAYLLGSGNLAADRTGFGIIVGAGLTLALYSFLYKDNPLFKFAEHIFVGVAAAYTLAQVWYTVLLAELLTPLFNLDENAEREPDWLLLIPTLLGFFILMRFSQRFGWLSRIAFAFVVGLGAGFTIPRFISSFILAQVEPTLAPLSWSLEGLWLLIILVGVVTVLVYFFFSVEHTGVVGAVSRIGIWFLMISFGASFGYTVMGRLSLLIGRVSFLFKDWLNIIQ